MYELSHIQDLQLLCSTDAVECQFDGEISQGCYNFWFSFIRHPRLPPIFTISPKVADNRGNTVYIYIKKYFF